MSNWGGNLFKEIVGKQNDIITAVKLAVTNALSFTNYDLSTAFSETTNISDDYILDNIRFSFSNADEKTITITAPDGTIIWEDTNTDTSVHLSNMNIAFKGGENITVAVTATTGTMNCNLVIK